MTMAGKIWLITGVSSGFGKALAREALAAGHRVVGTVRSPEAKRAFEQLGADGSAVARVLDVTEFEAIDTVVADVEATVGPVDVLVNNAGLALGLNHLQDGIVEDWEQMIDTNIKGLLYVSKMLLPLLKQSALPHIFNIGSTAGKTAYKNGNVYCATKFAVDALSQSMRIDLLPYKIKVTAVNPGMAETEFSIVRFKGDEQLAQKVYDDLKPLQAEDIAEVVYYCAILPPHVCINDLTLTCTNQAHAIYTLRDSELKR